MKNVSEYNPANRVNTEARAVARYLRISPRKVRLVIDAVRHKPVGESQKILMLLNKKAARLAEKLLKSAVANAKVLGLDEKRLYISDIRADGGPVLKRFMSRSMGRADRILKRTTHLSVTVKESDRVYRDFSSKQEAEEAKGGKTWTGRKKAAKGAPQAKAASAQAE